MSTQTIEKVDANIEQELNLVLVRNNLTEEKLAALNDRAMKHGGEIVSDAQYKEVLAVSQEIGKDVAIAKKNLKAMDRHRIDTNKAWMDMIREVMAKVEEPMVLIGAPMAAYRAKKAKEEEERAAAVKQENDEREQKVIELGFVRHPGPPEHRYILEDMVVGITSIINVPHDVWTNTYNDMRMKSEEVNAAKAEQEAMDRLDAAMAEQRQREQDAREAELAQREADMKAQEERMQSMVNEARKNELLAACPDMLVGEAMLIVRLLDYTDEEWSGKVKEISDGRKVAAETLRMEQERFAAEVARKTLISERVERLKAVGYEEKMDGSIGMRLDLGEVVSLAMVEKSKLSDMDESEIVKMVAAGRAELSRRQQEADKAARKKMEDEFAERQEAERLQAIEDEDKRVAALGDAEKWEEWVTLIRDRAPVMSTDICTGAVRRVMDVVRTESNNLS